MNPEETRAEKYLRSLNLGQVVFEPHGNVAPDFKIGSEIAVEVRRLNQSYERCGRLRGLEEDEIPLIAKIQKLLEAFKQPSNRGEEFSWFVCIDIRKRPIDSWRKIAHLLNCFLLNFYLSDRSIREAHLTPSIAVSLIPASTKLETFFRLGGSSDFDAGGRVIPELVKNISFCIKAKSTVLESLSAYRERWLLLVDHIGFGHKEDISIHREGWDKVILLAPEGKLTAYEPSALPNRNTDYRR